MPSTGRVGACEDTTGPEIHALSELRIYRVYYRDNDTTLAVVKSAFGKEGDTIQFNVPLDAGKVGEIMPIAVNNMGESCIGPHYVFAVPAVELRQGLQGDYFDDLSFGGYRFTRVDSNINFAWGLGSPDPQIGIETFSIIWRGFITIPSSDLYTFYTDVEDGNRMWIWNTLIIDDWGIHNRHENFGQAVLEAGTYPFTMEYMANNGNANCILKWSTASIPKQVIPITAFSH